MFCLRRHFLYDSHNLKQVKLQLPVCAGLTAGRRNKTKTLLFYRFGVCFCSSPEASYPTGWRGSLRSGRSWLWPARAFCRVWCIWVPARRRWWRSDRRAGTGSSEPCRSAGELQSIITGKWTSSSSHSFTVFADVFSLFINPVYLVGTSHHLVPTTLSNIVLMGLIKGPVCISSWTSCYFVWAAKDKNSL